MEFKKSILDVFNQISNEKQAAKPDLFLRLCNYLNSITPSTSEVDENNISKEVTYVLKRLIQGLGSPRAYVRKNYFATLTLLLSNSSFCSCPVALQYFKEIVDKQLGKYESKGEEGEVLTGKILSYGVALRSKVFLNSTKELQKEILSEMVTNSRERSYLPLLAYTFISDFISSIDETFFRTIVWPVLAKEILVDWSSQSFETLYCLLEVQNKFPSVLRKKFIMPVFKTPTILHTETIEYVQTMLINITWEPRLKHPLYISVGRLLVQGCENFEVLTRFWECVEEVLASSPTRLKLLAIFTIFSIIVKYIDLDQIPELLTPSFVKNIINSCRPSVSKTDKLCLLGRSTLQLIVSRAVEKSENSSSPVVYKILCKLAFDSRQLLIDKLTGVKVVSPCISKLITKHVKLLAKKCESIVLMKPTEKSGKISEHRWTFKDRSYATQLLARLISHPESQDMDWKIKHLKLMMKYAIFVPQIEDDVQISSELSAVLKNSFFTALTHQLSHLENHRMVLLSLVYYIDNILTTGEHKLRNTLSDEMLTYWKDSLSKIQKIDLKINKTVKRKTVMYVFQTMFLQMALHIFVDSATAKDILNELNRCYEKKKIQLEELKSKKKTTEFLDVSSEPMWIEIAVELLLSLLSRDTYMLRQLIARIFPHLCPFLTAQATFQILQVFDPRSNKYILTDNKVESDEDGSADDEEIEDVNENESEEVTKKTFAEIDSENESDSEVEENEDVEESAIEKTRQAVRDALGVAGSVTDTESIDLDDIDDEEGRKLDIALSEAFRSAKKSQNNKNKKQSPNEKALINFRIRVLDLVDIYLDNNPSLSLVLDTIPTLFTLLAFTIKDSHQKPLENRIRSTMKKIGCLKKCCKVNDVGEELLVQSLKILMDKGVHSTPVFLNLCNEMSECCTFLLRMGMQITNNEKPEKTSALYYIFATAVDNFFMKRDCLLPISLFENILLKTNWIGNVVLCKQILKLSFDSSVRGFRRNQGLSLLCHFYKNARLISGLKDICPIEMAELEDEILEHAIKILKQLKTIDDTCVKPSFICELFLLLYTMKNCKFLIGSSKWKELSEVLQSFLNNGPSIANISKKYLMKLCSTLHVTKSNRQSNTPRKRKTEENSSNVHMQKRNGFVSNNMDRNDHLDDDADELIDKENASVNESVSCKTVIKKKKSKRKNKKGEEHLNAKRLRNDLANNVEDFNFSEANFSEMTF